MRNVVCLILLIAAVASPVAAQPPSDSEPGIFGRIRQTIVRPWDHEVIASVRFGGEILGSSTREGFSFDVYNETATVETSQRYGSGFLLDAGVGWRLWRNLLIGGRFTRMSGEARSALTALVPHPIRFQQPRTASGRSDALDHREVAFHLSGIWMMQLRDNIDLGFSAGPSFYHVSHEFVGALTPENLREDAPPDFETVSIASVPGRKDSDSAVGYHVGLDGTYHLPWEPFGVTGFVRWSDASVTLDAVSDSRKVRAGGVQGGLGIRATFDGWRLPVPWR